MCRPIGGVKSRQNTQVLTKSCDSAQHKFAFKIQNSIFRYFSEHYSHSMSAKQSNRRQILSCICGALRHSSEICTFVFRIVIDILFTFSGNILTAAHGATNTWPSANFLPLQEPDSMLPSGPLSMQEAALVVSINYIGLIAGNLVAPHIVRKYGCKRVMLAIAIPQFVSWICKVGNWKKTHFDSILLYYCVQIISLLIIYAQNANYLYAAGIIGGLVGAGQVISMPMFVSEISHDKWARDTWTLSSIHHTLCRCTFFLSF